MKQSRRLGVDPRQTPANGGGGTQPQPAHIHGVRVAAVPQANLSKSMTEILGERGMFAETSPEQSGLPEPPAVPLVEPVASEQPMPVSAPVPASTLPASASALAVVPISFDLIDASPYQPRLIFDEEALSALADTIVDAGQNNAIIVRQKSNGRYELIAGERRLRAARLLRHKEILAVVKVLADTDAAILAVTDNDAREDLTDFERGRSYKRLLDEEIVQSQQELSRRVGRSMSTVSRCLSYLKLPEAVVNMLMVDPTLIGSRVVADFAAFTEQGHAALVTKAVEKLRDNKPAFSQESALNWLKGEVRRGENHSIPLPPRTLHLGGRPVADVKVDGRKVTLSCPKGVNPETLISAIEKALMNSTEALAE